LSSTTIPGIRNPIPAPTGLTRAKTVVASGLCSGINQNEDIFAGAFKIKGYPIPPNTYPIKTQ